MLPLLPAMLLSFELHPVMMPRRATLAAITAAAPALAAEDGNSLPPASSVAERRAALLPGVACVIGFAGIKAANDRRASQPGLRSGGGDPKEERLNKLLISLLIDLIGMATYIVPVAGETGDLAWAPISAYLIYNLYGNGLISGLAFAEELLPGLDIIPTATIAWVLENTEAGQRFAGKAPAASEPPRPPPESPFSSSQAPPSSRPRPSDAMKRAEGSIVDED